MKKLTLILRISGILILILLIAGVILLNVADFTISEEKITEAFRNTNYSAFHNNVESGKYNIHYVTTGDKNNPAVLFVHGSPGSWDNFLDLMTDSTLLNNYYMISIDRPGFGSSIPMLPEKSLHNQAEVIHAVLSKENLQAILVGHSYGGPVIVQHAVSYAEESNGLILVAGSVDPELEKTMWYQHLIMNPLISWMIPDELLNSNIEIMALKYELSLLSKEWDKIQEPVSIIQGNQDRLVPKENADFATSRLTNATVHEIRVDEMDHFVPWSHPDLIKKEIIRLDSILSVSN